MIVLRDRVDSNQEISRVSPLASELVSRSRHSHMRELGFSTKVGHTAFFTPSTRIVMLCC
jgi:hypothetical protein